MRRGFLLSTPRERRKPAPPSSSADTRTPTLSEPKPKQESTSSLASPSSTKAVPIPVRYVPPPPLPDFEPNLFSVLGLSGDKCDLAITPVPRGESRPELLTVFANVGGMLDALRTQYPRWPQSFSPPPPVYKIAPIEGTGLGMVATADIAAGDTIVRERPIFVIPRALPAASVEHGLRILQAVVDAADPANQRIFYALKNARGNTAQSKTKGIMDTNAMVAGPFPLYPAKYAGVARDMSRANHSCKPNATHAFDTATMTYVLRAVEPIRAGEEITISYLNDHLEDYDSRQEELSRRYLFKCRCKVCRLTGQARELSDLCRQVVHGRLHPDRIREDDEAFDAWLAKGAVASNVAAGSGHNPLQEDELNWVAMEQVGCFGSEVSESVLERLVKASAVLEREADVRRYATKAAEFRMALTGEDGGWRAVARNPRLTAWWGKRKT